MSEKIPDFIDKTGGPAFPSSIAVGPAGDVYLSTDGQEQSGMSLRDWFAGMALQGLLSRDTVQSPDCNESAKWAVMNPLEAYRLRSIQAYEYADMMLKTRKP